jgi:hypothetical protein
MTTLLAQIARLLPAANTGAAPEENGIAHQLMESADQRAGHSTHEAQELRDAAFAYLSVVR